MKRVYLAQNPADAHLLRGILENAGIPAAVHGDFLWSARGELPLTVDTSPSVWVLNETHYENALEIVAAFVSEAGAGLPSGEAWTCKHCGETNEGQFTECWRCGFPRKIPEG